MRNLVVMACALGLAACGVVKDPNAGVDAPCADSDSDGVCDTEDVCLAGDDSVDTDADTIANACDKCPGFDDKADADSDTVPNGCDMCAGFDDRTDLNGNSIPDGCDVQTKTIDLKAVPDMSTPPVLNYWRGWHSKSDTLVYGHTASNDNMLTGFSGTTEYNSYVVFPLEGFAAFSIVSVTLEIEAEAYNSVDPSETFSVWDVSTPPDMVETLSTQAIFDDLSTGMMYGMKEVPMTPAPAGVQTITLSAQAAIDLQAKLGQDFAIGLHVDTATATAQGWLRFAGGNEPRVARLIVRYLPVATP
jgi:hypothetical protein